MEKKLYVGGLPYSSTEADIKALFEEVGAGSVETVAIIKDPEGKSKGFGFVEMSTPELAQAAIEKFHGTDFGGRSLVVNVARPREDRPAGGSRQY